MSNSALASPVQPSAEDLEDAIKQHIASGELFESLDDLTPGYRKAIAEVIQIASISEVTVLTWAYSAFETAPDIGAKIAVCATIQDEVGHAHQQGLLAERFGIDLHKGTFEDDIAKIFTWPIMEFPIRNYIEFVVAQCLLDRAGLHWTKDIELHSSFAPYRRTLRKVNFEEGFHMRHGSHWTEYYWNESEETRAEVQKAFDWLFPHGVMWFGKPDDLKSRPAMLQYKIRAWTNDFMRDKWLQSACAFAKKLGVTVPAHYDEEQKKYILDMPYPMLYNKKTYEWSGKETTQQEYWKNARKGGPMRPAAYERLRREEWGNKLW